MGKERLGTMLVCTTLQGYCFEGIPKEIKGVVWSCNLGRTMRGQLVRWVIQLICRILMMRACLEMRQAWKDIPSADLIASGAPEPVFRCYVSGH